MYVPHPQRVQPLLDKNVIFFYRKRVDILSIVMLDLVVFVLEMKSL